MTDTEITAPDYTDYRTEWPEDGWREATVDETADYLSGHWTPGLLMRESEHGVEVCDPTDYSGDEDERHPDDPTYVSLRPGRPERVVY